MWLERRVRDIPEFIQFVFRVVRSMGSEGRGTTMRDSQGNWEVKVLLFADDTVMVAESVEGLRGLVSEFERRRNRFGPDKSKVM